MIVTDTENSIACSVGILTFNNEATLARALASVGRCDNIIICDGGSTDRTVAIAESFGATIIQQDTQYKFPNNTIKNYAGVRNQMLAEAKHKWFLFIDSDEYVPHETMCEIEACVLDVDSVPSAYWVPRKYVYDGTVIECASTYPNKQMRFFHRDGVTFFIKNVHERIDVKKDTPIKTLSTYMYVPIEIDSIKLRSKWAYYAELEIRHIDHITLWLIVRSLYQNIKISTLFIFRYIRNIFFCKGSRLPFSYELERHVYHIQIIRAQIRRYITERK